MNPVAQVRHHVFDGVEGSSLFMWCPGCDQLHLVGLTGNGPLWEWDGNLDAPTISPSILAFHCAKLAACDQPHPHYEFCIDPECGALGHYLPDAGGQAHITQCPAGPNGNCHSFVRNGKWEFLGDSAHKLAGQTISMVPLPDWIVKDQA